MIRRRLNDNPLDLLAQEQVGVVHPDLARERYEPREHFGIGGRTRVQLDLEAQPLGARGIATLHDRGVGDAIVVLQSVLPCLEQVGAFVLELHQVVERLHREVQRSAAQLAG